MKWLTKLFGGKAANDNTPKPVDEQALTLVVRHKLRPFKTAPGGDDEQFVSTAGFLTALEMRAAGSAILRLQGADTIRKAAHISLQSELMQGKMPFFYKDQGNATVFTTDTHLRARDIAAHAAKLLDLKQVSLADAYATALHDLDLDMKAFAELKKEPGFSYNNGKDVGQVFEIGADEDEYRSIQPVLRRKSPGNQPS
jgi:hypothetical protein